MKFINYNKFDIDNYLNDLQLVGSLSKLFADGNVPILHYRVTENIYCDSMNAENLSRADVSVDAKLRDVGVGIKTFIKGNEKTFQKIAEFNAQQSLYCNLKGIGKIKKIAELRNNRISFTQKAYGLKYLIYHCIARDEIGFYIFEEPMRLIDVDKIHIENIAQHTLLFSDGIEEYKFDSSKSTLYKRFLTKDYFASINVKILDNPIKELRKLNFINATSMPKVVETIVLPLYSFKRGDATRIIYSKSGLNQWNASGRNRNQDEIYIPFPAFMREMFENFFPNRNTPFNVELPNGITISMKVCQADGKALMSNPNKVLGKWLLRDVLDIPVGKIVKYSDLLKIGIDCVSFEKIENNYKLNFKGIGEFDNFLSSQVIGTVE